MIKHKNYKTITVQPHSPTGNNRFYDSMASCYEGNWHWRVLMAIQHNALLNANPYDPANKQKKHLFQFNISLIDIICQVITLIYQRANNKSAHLAPD